MKNNTASYARALAQILSKNEFDEKKIVKNFVKLLVSVGYENKAEEILALTEDLLLQKQGKNKITFETARTVTPSQKKIMESIVKKGDIVSEKINPELIAGIKIIINGSMQFDASMQSKLQHI